MSGKTQTPLQKAIIEALQGNLGFEDDKIAKIAYSKLNPGQEWTGKNPTSTYVKKMRRRLARKMAPPEVEIEDIPKDMFREPEAEEQEAEEPFDPLKAIEDEMGEEPEITTDIDFDTSVEFTDDDLNAIIGLPFSKMAAYTGYSGWRLDPDDPDDQRFITLSNKMAHKYVPGILEKYGLEVLWSISLLGFVGERVAGQRQHKASLLKRAEQPKDEAPETKITPAEPQPQPQAVEPEKQQLPPGQLAAGEDEFKRRLKKS